MMGKEVSWKKVDSPSRGDGGVESRQGAIFTALKTPQLQHPSVPCKGSLAVSLEIAQKNQERDGGHVLR